MSDCAEFLDKMKQPSAYQLVRKIKRRGLLHDTCVHVPSSPIQCVCVCGVHMCVYMCVVVYCCLCTSHGRCVHVSHASIAHTLCCAAFTQDHLHQVAVSMAMYVCAAPDKNTHEGGLSKQGPNNCHSLYLIDLNPLIITTKMF